MITFQLLNTNVLYLYVFMDYASFCFFYKVITCDDPQPIARGEFTPNVGPYIFNSSITYTCEEGYDIIGEQSAYCQSNGTWSTKTPTCQCK